MKVTQHPASYKYIVVTEPTAQATARATELQQRNWARVEKNGTLTVHSNFRNEFERMIPAAAAPRTERVYVTAEMLEDGIGVHLGWNTVTDAGTNNAGWS